jgi:aryl-alcohol dehydrogenase-like predicted oxidoreductase
MKYVDLGRTGVRVSELCMGTMTFGAQADEEMSGKIFARCLDAGINHFDCADIYADGRSEEILGRLIKGKRDDLVIATKAYFATGDGPNDRGASRYHLVRACEASLRRLGTDRVDLFYIHRFDDSASLEEVLRGLELLVQSGKILYPAFSNFAAWQVTKALGVSAMHGWAPAICIQPMYNLLKRQAEVELLPMAKSEGLGVFPYSTLGGGYLTGKYTRDDAEASGRITESAMYQVRYGEEHYPRIAVEFTELANELGHHPASLAIAWAASHPAVTAPLLGARNLEQLEPALASVEIDMTPELRARISALSPTPPPATDRNEEQVGHRPGK